MAASQTQFFLFTFLLIAVSLQAQARESRFFSKTTPFEQPRQGEDLPQQQQEVQSEFTPLSSFKETSLSEENQNGHGLYSHEPTQFPPTTTTTTPTTTNPETQFTPIDYTSFKTTTNEYNSFDSKDVNTGFSGYGMSDTRLLEKGKYFYDIQKEGYQKDFPYQKGTSGSGFEYPTANRYGGYGSEKYEGYENTYGGYNGNQNRYGGYGGNENFNGGYGGKENEKGYVEPNNFYNEYKNDEFIP
ncbi:protein E6-like [Nymphaea colorata]|uniref:protein E6-like n=1 Tax=Nymphaea colorata TaxID=210225 RepID=UPI00129E3330|nr:protein E6-like [Nymphaea colorata]